MAQPPFNGGVYYISPANAPNKVLGCAGGNTQSGTQVVLWDRDGSGNQQWRVEDRGYGNFALAPLHAQGQHLDTNNGCGLPCHTWDDGGNPHNPNQVFRLEPLGQHIVIRRASDNAVIEVASGRGDNGATLAASQGGGMTLWNFLPTTGAPPQPQAPPPPPPLQPQQYPVQQQPMMPQQPQNHPPIMCRVGHVAKFNTNGFKCDECGNRGGRMTKARPGSHRCEICSYDICAACQKERGLPQTAWICPEEGRTLSPVTNRDKRCDVCRNMHGMDALKCKQCDWTICGTCINTCNMLPVDSIGPHLVVHQAPNPNGGSLHRVFCRSNHPLRPLFNNAAQCDECGKNSQRYFQHCGACDYHICVICCQAKSLPGPVLECSEGHHLKPRANAQYSCDMCHTRSGGVGALRCDSCDFDVCTGCQSKMKYQMDAVTAVAAAGPHMSPAGQPVCTVGHILKVSYNGFRCDVCNRSGGTCGNSRVCSLKCEACNFDICNDCYAEKKLVVGPPVCGAGHVLTPRPNAHYLCDRCRKQGNLHGMRCKDCDYDICVHCMEKAHFSGPFDVLQPLQLTPSNGGGTLNCRYGHKMHPHYNVAAHKCDECQHATKFRLYCDTCEYSCCPTCSGKYGLLSMPLEDKEGHRLQPRANAKYSCDVCHHRGEMGAYRCDQCDFDICPKCMGQFHMQPGFGAAPNEVRPPANQAPQQVNPPQQQGQAGQPAPYQQPQQPPQQQGGYPPQMPPQQPQQGYPPQQQQGGYPAQATPQQQGQPQGGGYPPQQQQGGYPQQQPQAGYPPQQQPQGGYPQQQQQYPPQQQPGQPGLPYQQQQQGGYPAQATPQKQPQGGYPPQQQGQAGSPYQQQQQGYPPQAPPPQQQQQQQQQPGYGGYPQQQPQGGYPPQQQGQPQGGGYPQQQQQQGYGGGGYPAPSQ